MKKIFERYSWLFEWIGTAIIAVIGLVIALVPITLSYIVGVVFIILGLFRLVPLIKTTSDKLMKWLYLAECILEVGAGCYVIYAGNTSATGELGKGFGYVIGGILYLRGLMYLIGTSLRKEKTYVTLFIAHIAFITVGSMIIISGGFSTNTLGWVIFGLAIICALFIGVRGYKDYRNYRYKLAIDQATNRIDIKKEEKKELPANNEISIDTTIIDPKKKEEKIDEVNING